MFLLLFLLVRHIFKRPKVAGKEMNTHNHTHTHTRTQLKREIVALPFVNTRAIEINVNLLY